MNPEYRYDELSLVLDELVAEVEFICNKPELSDPALESIVIHQLEELDDCIMKVRAEMDDVRSKMSGVGVEAWR